MKKNLFIITFFLGAFSLSAQTQKQEKTITVEVQNNWNQPKADAPVVINLHELHTCAENFFIERFVKECFDMKIAMSGIKRVACHHIQFLVLIFPSGTSNIYSMVRPHGPVGTAYTFR